MENKLESPVTYQGGKSRIASKIIDIIISRNDVEDMKFYDLCCGSGAITLECINRDLSFSEYRMLDFSVWGDFWKSIGDGNFLIDIFKIYVDNLPKEKENIQKYLLSMSNESPYDGVFLSHVYRYLLLQAGSFGGKQIYIEDGKWKNNSFRSYWLPTEKSNRRSPVNPMMPMPITLYKRVEVLWSELHTNIIGENSNIEDYVEFSDNSIVYVDPPYKNTTKYGNTFDILDWVKKVKQNNDVRIYVSEQYPLGEDSFLISDKRNKGNISGENNKGVAEWLTEF